MHKPVDRGDELVLDVEGLGDGPDALAKIDNYVVFVPGALPGERVRVEITSAGRKYGRAEVRSIEARSPDRREPRCRHFLQCGGCHYQHLDYAAQLHHKTERLRKSLAFALKRDDVPVREMVGPPDPWHERTKVALHLSGRGRDLRAGFYRLRKPDLVAIEECPASDAHALALAMTTVDALRPLDLRAWGDAGGQGLMRSVLVRHGRATGEAAVVLVGAGEPPPQLERILSRLHDDGATTVAWNRNEGPSGHLLGRDTQILSGPRRVAEEIDGLRYLFSPAAYFQTSPFGAAFLADAVRRLGRASSSTRVLDLFSGGGLLSLALARDAGEVVGVDGDQDSVRDATASARLNKLRNVAFFVGRPEQRLPELLRRWNGTADLLVLAPPGACPKSILDATLRAAPSCILYLASDPQALGRDLATLEKGYHVDRVEPVDMFPQTHRGMYLVRLFHLAGTSS